MVIWLTFCVLSIVLAVLSLFTWRKRRQSDIPSVLTFSERQFSNDIEITERRLEEIVIELDNLRQQKYEYLNNLDEHGYANYAIQELKDLTKKEHELMKSYSYISNKVERIQTKLKSAKSRLVDAKEIMTFLVVLLGSVIIFSIDIQL